MQISVITYVVIVRKHENTILSILSQTNKNFEYIIVDGNSHDNTKKIIEKYRKYIKFYISEKIMEFTTLSIKELKIQQEK